MDDTQSEGTPKNKERNITAHFFHLIENHYKENRKVESYAEEIGISAKHLAYVIKKTTGKYPSEWLENYVLLESKKLLRNTDLSVQEISYDLNFSTPSHFGKFFKSQTGMTPKKFRDSTLHIR
jgi:AraC-like DNA-binding protein